MEVLHGWYLFVVGESLAATQNLDETDRPMQPVSRVLSEFKASDCPSGVLTHKCQANEFTTTATSPAGR